MRTIKFYGQQIKFPDACVCCMRPVHHEHKLEKTFYYGKQSILMELPVPMCHQHYEQATTRSPAQVTCERIGIAGGGAVWIIVAWALLRYWSVTGQGSLWFNIPLAIISGACLALVTWAIMQFWITPLFAFAATKAVLQSVRMTRFDPHRQLLDLTFENETIAELTARENLSNLAAADDTLQVVHISAQILDHDIRMYQRIETNILLTHRPDIKEAEQILQPVIDCLMVQQLGEGTPYELSMIEITPTY